MRTFEMIRNADETGVSGTGLVLEGIEFSNGEVVVCWESKKHPNSISIFASFADFEDVHITPHPSNKTEIIWHDASFGDIIGDWEE